MLYKYSRLLLAIIIIFIAGCNNKETKQTDHRAAYSTTGVSMDTLNLIYDGPKGFTLNYFPAQAIQVANISRCEITETDSTSSRVARIITFDKNGNIEKDENNFFSFWFQGTVRGTYLYYYNIRNNRILMRGIAEEGSGDSMVTKWNYNKNGLLSSREYYDFKRKLKPGVGGDYFTSEDFEKERTWNLTSLFQFSYSGDTLLIVDGTEEKVSSTERYIFTFDSLKRLQTIKKYELGSLTETTSYFYTRNTITEHLKRKLNDGKDWLHTSRATIDGRGRQLGCAVLNDDGNEKVKMIVKYNTDGTINTIRYNSTIQYFKYSHY